MEPSIKAQVVALAQDDPFLTVKDLAEKVGTTTRYVRTILSEAGLSLHEMRRLYARRLERTAGPDKVTAQVADLPQDLTVTKIPGIEVASYITDWVDRELFLASRVEGSNFHPCYVQLITPHKLTLGTDAGSIRELLLSEDAPWKVEIGRQKVEILQAPKELAAAFSWPQSSRVLKLTTLLTSKQEPLALEIKWLGLEGLVLEWSQLQPELVIGLGG
ncbi:MAG TPA: hypothetical protein DDW87_05845 [Firmicutes bacterium]|nr:hypothetical protein [Bacillota bacterium]